MATFLYSRGGDLVGPSSSTGSFQKWLPDKIRDELAVGDDARLLDELVDQAIRLDNRMRERRMERGGQQEFVFRSFATSAPPEVSQPSDTLPSISSSSLGSSGTDEPMHLGWSKLTLQEMRRRRQCGGYLLRLRGTFPCRCPEVPKDQAQE